MANIEEFLRNFSSIKDHGMIRCLTKKNVKKFKKHQEFFLENWNTTATAALVSCYLLKTYPDEDFYVKFHDLIHLDHTWHG